jgi:hypothetical protein
MEKDGSLTGRILLLEGVVKADSISGDSAGASLTRRMA